MGAKNLGATTILIYTGKTKPPLNTKYKSVVDYEANNLSEVIKIIEKFEIDK